MADLIPLDGYREHSSEEMQRRAQVFYQEMRLRRTVRDFSDKEIPADVLESCLRAAGTAPSGANLQPWHFAVVREPGLKRRIREAAEVEEREFYDRRAPKAWLEDLAHLGTDQYKPYLERAPALIVIFAEHYRLNPDGSKRHTYYASESVGIATGMLITALHYAGLASLTHTPSPMRFLNDLLERPTNERAYMILVAGYPEDGAQVPDITKKPLEEISSFR
jgi:iodotyrosine deiodinase